MGLDDFPKYVRYDFFMAILGLLMFYFSFSDDNIYNSFIFHWMLIIVGLVCTIYGIYQMKNNYKKEQKIETIRRIAEELELQKKINKNKPKTLP